MKFPVSPLAVVRDSLGSLGANARRLLIPALLMVAVFLGKHYFGWLMPRMDPFTWVLFGLPFELLLLPLEVWVIAILLAEEGERHRLPRPFLKTTLTYLGYIVILKCLWWVAQFAVGLIAVALAEVVNDAETLSSNRLLWVGLGSVVGLPFVCQLLRLVLAPVAVVDGRSSPLGLSFELTRKRVLPMLLSVLLLLGVPLLLMIGFETAFSVRWGAEEPLAWAMAVSLFAAPFLLIGLSLTTTWYKASRGEER